jgi:hypothetical protein
MPGCLFNLLKCEWDWDFQEIGPALQAFEVFAPQERLAVGDADRFEEAVAVKEAAIV